MQSDGELLKGNNDIWKIINPLAPNSIVNANSGDQKKRKNIVKIGPYMCESYYTNFAEQAEMTKGQEDDDGEMASPSLKNLPIEYDNSILAKWG